MDAALHHWDGRLFGGPSRDARSTAPKVRRRAVYGLGLVDWWDAPVLRDRHAEWPLIFLEAMKRNPKLAEASG